MSKARRYNSGKLRIDLIPIRAVKCVAEVYTKGAHKYSIYQDEEGNEIFGKDIPIEDAGKYTRISDGANNWRNGLPWMDTMAAVKRHIAEWEQGKDVDPELGTKHLGNAIWGLNSLIEFETTHPELDDRPLPFLQTVRYGIDIDDVLADFIGAYCDRYNIKERPKNWMFDKVFMDRYENDILEDDSFYTHLKTIVSPSDLSFEPVVYITSRREKVKAITEKWLFETHKYPVAPVIIAENKLQACKDYKVERFIDDKYSTFVHLNKNGVFCYLFDCSHNQKYDVGFRRINRDTIRKLI
jgi:5'(3')-deoxyribonucleotidase